MDKKVNYNPVAEAYQILVSALDNEETNVYELTAAMQKAIGFLGEALE